MIHPMSISYIKILEFKQKLLGQVSEVSFIYFLKKFIFKKRELKILNKNLISGLNYKNKLMHFLIINLQENFQN